MKKTFVSGSTLSLSCTIMPPSTVDTSFIIQSNWTTPVMSHDRINTDNDTNPMLDISSVETADSGVYSCSARATDASDSQYILSSIFQNATVDITVSKSLLVLISVV